MEETKRKYTKNYSLDDINYNLDDAILVPEYARIPLLEALSLLPREVIDFITEHCYFITQGEELDGSYHDFRSFHEETTGFILIPKNLWKEEQIRIAFTIAHEVAHAFKRHILSDQDLQCDLKQEKEADRLAVKWLSKHYNKKSLMELINK